MASKLKAVRVLDISFALIIGASRIVAQDANTSWYPVHPADTWVYEHEQRDGSRGGILDPNIMRWKSEEKIVSAQVIPEGMFITKEVRTLNQAPDRQDVHQLHYLIHADCLYALDDRLVLANDQTGQGVKPLDDQNRLRPEFRDELARGDSAPDVCFPLALGKTWGKLPEDRWEVVGVDDDAVIPPDDRGTVFHLVSFPGSGETDDVWFAKGVGIVREVHVHHGTYWESRQELVSRTPWWSLPPK